MPGWSYRIALHFPRLFVCLSINGKQNEAAKPAMPSVIKVGKPGMVLKDEWRL